VPRLCARSRYADIASPARYSPMFSREVCNRKSTARFAGFKERDQATKGSTAK
jgi:hypothetical protein